MIVSELDSVKIRAWAESCRDLGRGALRAESREMMRGFRRCDAVPLEVALDTLDRQIDNILSRIEALAPAEGGAT